MTNILNLDSIKTEPKYVVYLGVSYEVRRLSMRLQLEILSKINNSNLSETDFLQQCLQLMLPTLPKEILLDMDLDSIRQIQVFVLDMAQSQTAAFDTIASAAAGAVDEAGKASVPEKN
jgi:hypothetical protein